LILVVSPALVTTAEHVLEARSAPADELAIHEIVPALMDMDFRVRLSYCWREWSSRIPRMNTNFSAALRVTSCDLCQNPVFATQVIYRCSSGTNERTPGPV
jgi:hypothetical protein